MRPTRGQPIAERNGRVGFAVTGQCPNDARSREVGQEATLRETLWRKWAPGHAPKHTDPGVSPSEWWGFGEGVSPGGSRQLVGYKATLAGRHSAALPFVGRVALPTCNQTT